MEVDWEFEIADGAPVIDATWTGFIELRSTPNRIVDIAEAVSYPIISQALLRLNDAKSPVWTAKCDVWSLDIIDPDEMDTEPGAQMIGLACYLDLLPAHPEAWATVGQISLWCKQFCADLRSSSPRRCRTDLIIRRAIYGPERNGLGITAYIAGCGMDPIQAADSLWKAIDHFTSTTMPRHLIASAGSNYNEENVGE